MAMCSEAAGDLILPDGGPCLSLAVNADGLVAVGTELGCLCLFDKEDKLVIIRRWPETVISSLAWATVGHNVLYVACSERIIQLSVDVAGATASETELCRTDEELNCIAVNDCCSHVAAGDDGGIVSVVELCDVRPPPPSRRSQQQRGREEERCVEQPPPTLPKRRRLLRRHENICSSVCFVPRSTDRLLSAGLDAQLVLWDYLRGRALAVVVIAEALSAWSQRLLPVATTTVATASAGSVEGSLTPEPYLVNPPLVHSVAVTSDGGQALCTLENGCLAVFALHDNRGNLPVGGHRCRPLELCHVIERAHSRGVTAAAVACRCRPIGSGIGPEAGVGPGSDRQLPPLLLLATGGNDARVCLWTLESSHCGANGGFLAGRVAGDGSQAEMLPEKTDSRRSGRGGRSRGKRNGSGGSRRESIGGALWHASPLQATEHGSKVNCLVYVECTDVLLVGDQTERVRRYSAVFRSNAAAAGPASSCCSTYAPSTSVAAEAPGQAVAADSVRISSSSSLLARANCD